MVLVATTLRTYKASFSTTNLIILRVISTLADDVEMNDGVYFKHGSRRSLHSCLGMPD